MVHKNALIEDVYTASRDQRSNSVSNDGTIRQIARAV